MCLGQTGWTGQITAKMDLWEGVVSNTRKIGTSLANYLTLCIPVKEFFGSQITQQHQTIL